MAEDICEGEAGSHWPGEMGLGCEVANARQRGQQGWTWRSLLLSGSLCEISCTGFQLARSGSFRTQGRIPKFRTETKLRGLPNFWSCSFQGQSYYKIVQSHRAEQCPLRLFLGPVFSSTIRLNPRIYMLMALLVASSHLVCIHIYVYRNQRPTLQGRGEGGSSFSLSLS